MTCSESMPLRFPKMPPRFQLVPPRFPKVPLQFHSILKPEQLSTEKPEEKPENAPVIPVVAPAIPCCKLLMSGSPGLMTVRTSKGRRRCEIWE